MEGYDINLIRKTFNVIIEIRIRGHNMNNLKIYGGKYKEMRVLDVLSRCTANA